MADVKRALFTLVAVVFAVSTIGSEPKTSTPTAPPARFEVARGKTAHGFAYDLRSGQLLYKAKRFKPEIVGSENITAFEISVGPDRSLAAAVGKDIDGQDSLHLLKLPESSAVYVSGGCGVRSLLWSHSRKYLVALCSYEGDSLFRADLKTGEIIGAALEPSNKAKLMWSVSGEPRWDGSTDVLLLNVDEYCNPYEDDACGPDAVNSGKVIATRKVIVDAETLAFRLARR